LKCNIPIILKKNIDIALSKGVIILNVNPLTIPYTYGEIYNVNSLLPENLAGINDIFIVRNYLGVLKILMRFPFYFY